MYDTWLTRTEAAEWLRCSPAKASYVIKEMEALGLPGVWRDGKNFVRVNQGAMSEYLYKRRAIRKEERRAKHERERMGGTVRHPA